MKVSVLKLQERQTPHLLLSVQTFQRIQRNRQSRIRVKLSRRAAKRQDEILEEEDHDDHIAKAKTEEHGAHGKAQNKLELAPNFKLCLDSGDEEDIDIVGDGCNNNNHSDSGNNKENSGNKNNSKSNLSNNELAYGPPQFTEADILACMNEHAIKKEKMEVDDKDNGETADENAKDTTNDDDACDEEQKEQLASLNAKAKRTADSNKCSKCMVRGKSCGFLLSSLLRKVSVSCRHFWKTLSSA